MPQIRSINTHYICNTVLTFVQNTPVAATYRAKFEDITGRGLPYLVAVDENTGTDDRSGDGNGNGSDNALVLGYAYLAPFRGTMLSYAFTVELTLYVRPGYHSRGVGSRLLDTLLEAARGARHLGVEVTESELGETQTSGGYDTPEGKTKVEKVFAVDPEDGKPGARIRSIIAIMAIDPEGPDHGNALRRWYVNRGFVERGRMEKVGFKGGFW
jgi:phosphinothricin acetyltransferase